jgi:DNA-binding MarR family transcriptional regulator
VLLYLAVAGIIISVRMITLNGQRNMYRIKNDPQDPAEIAFSLNMNGLALGMLILSAICCGIAIWYIFEDFYQMFFSPPIYGPIPDLEPLIASAVGGHLTYGIPIVAAAALVSAWGVVARTARRERTSLKTITQDNLMGNDTRRRMVALIEQVPGIHFSRIRSTLRLSPRTTRDQLSILQAFGKISTVPIDGKKSYFLRDAGSFGSLESDSWLSMLAFVRRGGRENLLLAMLEHPSVSFVDLVTITGEPRSTIRRKIGSFEQRKYITVNRNGREMAEIQLVPSIETLARKILQSERNTTINASSA